MKKIAILTGGPGYEREVALKSAELFKKYIKDEYEAFVFPEDTQKFLDAKDNFDVVIPIFHGEFGEDGKIFAFLDILGKKYPFSSQEVHAFCLNKYLANSFLDNFWIHTGKQILIDEKELESLSPHEISKKNEEQIQEVWFPCIMKPTHGGSSFYTYKINSLQEFEEKLSECQWKFKDSILIQEFIVWDEYSVPVIQWKALPYIMKVQKDSDTVFDYTSKYEDDIEIFPEIEPSLKDSLMNTSEQVFSKLWCRTLARVDFIVRDGIPYFLEINTIPGMTEVSILPKAWKLTGKSLEEFVEMIIAEAR